MNTYFDNATTSFPKPKELGDYFLEYLGHGGSYGRSGYPKAINSSRFVEETRYYLSQIFHTRLISNIIFTYNSTYALNLILKGFKFAHGRVLISPLEHNAVYRPLADLNNNNNLQIDILPHFDDGLIDVSRISEQEIKNVDLVIINHVSNVNGVIQPIKEIKRRIGATPILVDASQSAGKVEILIDEWGVDFLVFTGHKGLLGPTGIGGFYIRDNELIEPVFQGGTGSFSDSFDMPLFLPDKFEMGTPNVLGIHGLLGSLKHRPDQQYSSATYFELINNLNLIDKIKLLKANDHGNQSDLFSIVVDQPDSFVKHLYSEYGIEVRDGLHCAPLAHKSLGSYPKGSIRFSLSPYHSNADLDYLYSAIIKLSSKIE